MNFEYVDNIYRSRITLMNILEERGFDVTPYRKFSPDDISCAVPEGGNEKGSGFQGLSFTVIKKDDPEYTCEVIYSRMSRQKLESLLLDRKDVETTATEVIIMILDTVTEIHHTLALKVYRAHNTRISFFSIPILVFDPRHHVFVPKHEIVPRDDHKKIMEEWNLLSTAQMPMIRFHADPIVRILGAVPGDILRITRPSPSAGTYVSYRVVSP
jgi:DNA-directed RNA polymerase subunit H (RpoH/RPB5)